MRYGAVWEKFPITHVEVRNYLRKYGHLLKWKNHKENILEIGCASGRITRDILYPHVENHVEKLVAIDKSEEVINIAKRNNDRHKIEYRVMDIMDKGKIQKMSGQFDHIFSFYCAQWMVDQRSFIHDLHKMLKPQGQLCMTLLPNTAIMQSFARINKDEKWWKYLPRDRVFADYTKSPAEYVANLAENVGFKVDLCESEKKSSVVDDLEGMVRAIVSIYSHLNLLPPQLKEEYFHEHFRYTSNFCTHLGGNKYDFPYETLICICSKNM